jgi:hypothetical protein
MYESLFRSPAKKLVEAVGRGMKSSEAAQLFGVSLSFIKRNASMVPSIVNSAQGRRQCRYDEGCAPLPDQSPRKCRNLPTVHQGQRIA